MHASSFMKQIPLTGLSLIISLALCLLFAPGQLNQARASKIVSVVNGAVITDFDVAQRQRLERLLSGGKKRLGKTAALNMLIEDKLKLIEARDRNMTASDKEIDAAFANMARNVRMNQKQMTGVFRQAGVNTQTVKDWLKVQISWRTLIRARYNAQIRVEEAEIEQALRGARGETATTTENALRFDLTQVTFVTRSKASKKEVNQRLGEAKRFRSGFASCDRDLEAARRLKDVAVTRIGRRESTDLPPPLAKRLRETEVNKLTAPVKVGNGYEMIAVCEKKDLGAEQTLRSETEAKLKDERGKAMSRRYLGELRARAIIERR